MRRLEHQRKVRGVRIQARNSAEAIMFLAQIVRERRRLEQERSSLLQRIGRINLRLDEIGSTETKVLPAIKVASEPNAPPQVAVVAPEPSAPPRVAVRSSGMGQRALPTGFAEFSLTY